MIPPRAEFVAGHDAGFHFAEVAGAVGFGVREVAVVVVELDRGVFIDVRLPEPMYSQPEERTDHGENVGRDVFRVLHNVLPRVLPLAMYCVAVSRVLPSTEPNR